MENAKLKSSKVYAWVLVIALGLMSAGTTGSYSVIAGSFVAPVCEEFGFDYSIFSYYFTATLIGLAAALPFVGKLIPKVVGKVWLPVVELILLAAGAGIDVVEDLRRILARDGRHQFCQIAVGKVFIQQDQYGDIRRLGNAAGIGAVQHARGAPQHRG